MSILENCLDIAQKKNYAEGKFSHQICPIVCPKGICPLLWLWLYCDLIPSGTATLLCIHSKNIFSEGKKASTSTVFELL